MATEINEALQFRYDQIDNWHREQLGYATSLYVNEHITSDEYNSIVHRMKKYYDDKKESSYQMFLRITENNS